MQFCNTTIAEFTICEMHGVVAGVGYTVDGERIRLRGGQLNCSVSLA